MTFLSPIFLFNQKNMILIKGELRQAFELNKIELKIFTI